MIKYEVRYKQRDGNEGGITVMAVDVRDAMKTAFHECPNCFQVTAAFPIKNENSSNRDGSDSGLAA